jgi:alpha-N-arabinofuranosidase
MYRDHQDATLVHSYVDSEYIDFNGTKLPCVSHSASVKNGRMLITLANCSLQDDYELDCKILFGNYAKCSGEILAGGLRGQNTFEKPGEIVSKPYGDFILKDSNLRVTLPHGSIVALSLQ